MDNQEKAQLLTIVTGMSAQVGNGLLFDPDNIASVKAVPLTSIPNTKTSITFVDGTVREFTYNRQPLDVVLKEVLGASYVFPLIEATAEDVATYLTLQGIKINPEELDVVALGGNVALRLHTTDKSIRYVGQASVKVTNTPVDLDAPLRVTYAPITSDTLSIYSALSSADQAVITHDLETGVSTLKITGAISALEADVLAGTALTYVGNSEFSQYVDTVADTTVVLRMQVDGETVPMTAAAVKASLPKNGAGIYHLSIKLDQATPLTVELSNDNFTSNIVTSVLNVDLSEATFLPAG